MRTTRWRVAAVVGIIAVAIATFFGLQIQHAVACVIALTCGFVAFWRVRTNGDSFKLVAGCTLAFGALTAAGQGLQTFNASTAAEALQALAYVSLIMGLWRHGNLRGAAASRHGDLDALIVAGNVAVVTTALFIFPAVEDPTLTTAAAMARLGFNVLDIGVLFALARLALSPSRKTPEFYVSAVLSVSLLVSDWLYALAMSGHASTVMKTISLLALCVGFIVSAIAKASKTSSPDKAVVTELSARHLAAMTIAIAATPATLVFISLHYERITLAAWGLMSSAVVWRIALVIRGRAGLDRINETLGDVYTQLRAATSRGEVLQVAIGAMNTLTTPTDSAAVVDIVTIDGGRWRQTATTRAAGVGVRGQVHIEQIIRNIVDEYGFEGASSWPARQLQLNNRWVCFAPLVAQNEVHGWMLTDMSQPVSETTQLALSSLCGVLGLALEQAVATEMLQQQRSDRRFRTLMENSSDAIFIIDTSGRTIFASAAAERILRSAGDSTNLFQAIHPQDRAAFVSLVNHAPEMMQAQSTRQVLEIRVATSRGADRWIEVSAADFSRDPDVGGIIISAHDVTNRKMNEDDLRHRVLSDELTGIANLALLRERADHALAMRRTDNSVAAMLFIDLEEFRLINEKLGQAAGDEMLKVVAFRIDNFVRGHDTAARISEDRFAVLLQDVSNENEMGRVAERVMTAVQRPLEFDGKEFAPKARIGVCVARPDYNAQVLIRNAETAVDAAKTEPKRISFFSETMAVNAGDKLDLRRDLALAITNNQLRVFYQPIIQLKNSRLVAFEALIRWEHPERGLVSPGSFIPLAEETGLIVDIGAWVLSQACSQLAVWRSERPELNLHMSINISNRQLKDDDLIEVVERSLRHSDLEPSSLILEMSETGSLSGDLIRMRLAQLRQIGVQIAADDFGGGFSNYPTLEELPFTMVKIDRSLLAGYETNPQYTAIALRKIVELAHSVNLLVAAEGIEDENQKQLLMDLGVDLAQGYLFGRPVGASYAQEAIDRLETVS